MNLFVHTALDIAFGSLYSYEVDVSILTENLISVLAASRMFQLDGLLQHCEDSMLETICTDNVCKFYDAASRYGLTVVQERYLYIKLIFRKTCTRQNSKRGINQR